MGPADNRLNTVVLPKKERNGTVSDRRIVIVVSQSQSQVIVGGTLIRRSPLDGVTDIHMKPALRGMTLVKIPVLVSSLVCN